MTIRLFLTSSAIVALAVGLALTASASAQVPAATTPRRAEVIRGRVTNDSARALAGVTVIATMAPDRTFRQAVTDSGGRYEIRFDQGTGDYLVYSAPTGYRAFRRRIAVGPTAEITVDIRLVFEAAQLAAVRVTATKPRPIPDGGFARDPTATEFNTMGVIGGLSPDMAGNLAALAATVPGISVTSDGQITAFGLPGQVTTTFNGMSFAGVEIPRDARTSVSVITSAYDPSIGGFGGARIGVQMAGGGRVPESFARLTLDSPALQFVGAPNSLGQRFMRGEVNLMADGPFGETDAKYNAGLTARRTTRDAMSLLDAGRDAFSLAGIAPDSVARLRAISGRLGIPLTATGAPSVPIDETVTFLGRVDHYPDPGRYGKPWANWVSLTGYASMSRSDAPGGSVTSAPTTGRESQSATAQLIGQWMHMSEDYSTELTSSLAGTRVSSDPYLRIPAASVRVESQLDEFDPVTSGLSFGGSPGSSSISSNAAWETIGVFHSYFGSANNVKIAARSIIGATQINPGLGPLGAFAFNSLADLEANRPSSFSRTLNSPASSASLWAGALSIGDLWQITPNFQLQPGVRLEANRFLTSPELNPVVANTFGVTNDHVPNTIHASPRLGFAWAYRPSRSNTTTGAATLGRIWLPPRAILSGGIGEFRQEMTAGTVAPAILGTGLPGGATQLTCIGGATPTPDWQQYLRDPSFVPAACAGGAPSSFTDAASSVSLFDPSYAPSRSWRGNLQFGSALGPFRYSVNAVYSYNIDQRGIVDLNFANQPRFALATEANRPIFVTPASIVPSTGIVATSDSRVTPALGHVSEIVSDLHSTARQMTLFVAPELDRALISVAYTLSDVSATTRGFDDVTFGSPTTLVTGRSRFQSRHSFNVNAGYSFGTVLGLSLTWNIRSGMPYTPVVGSDVNGDGRVNDRAFIFDPATATDAQLGRDLRSLIASTSKQAGTCLDRQIGTVAAANGCEGPWTSSMNAGLSTNFLHVRGGRLVVASINFANPLGGLDQLLHGSDHLAGWGTPAYPDRVLYTVRGFDPATNGFQYAVNPRFGSTRPTETTIRAPFRMTLDVRVELGRPRRQQEFERFLEMNPLRNNHERAPVDSLRARLNDYMVSDYYDVLVRMRDSLLLTREQVTTLQTFQTAYMARADMAWQDITSDMIAHPADSDVNELSRRIDDVAGRVWTMQRAEIPHMRGVMTPAQLELVDIILKRLVDSAKRLPSHPFLF
jgi:hypothetical protein